MSGPDFRLRRVIRAAVGCLAAAAAWAQSPAAISGAGRGAASPRAPVRFAAVLGLGPEAGAAPSHGAAASAAPTWVLNLREALQLARANSPQFTAAVAALGAARADETLARAALLPTLSYNNQYLYTQGGTGQLTPRFIANNAVHEYVSQAQAHEDLFLGGAHLAALRRAGASAALARAQLVIARRGLDAAVTTDYYALLAADHKFSAAAAAVSEANDFYQLSVKLQKGGEVAEADVIKAELQLETQRRAEQEAELARDQARLNLAVLLFPRFDENFSLTDDLNAAPPLPSLAQATALAGRANPQVGAALATLGQARADVGAARAGYFPTLSLDYWYGIDADHFATYDGKIRNLGYAAQATLAIPLWNWGATGARVRQAELRRAAAAAELSYAQRKLLADLRSFYAAAQTARAELASLENSERLAERSLRLTTLQYQAGDNIALAVVDAQAALAQARVALADGQARYHDALATLATITGPW